MILVRALEKGCRELIEPPLLRFPGSGLEAERIAIGTSSFGLGRDVS
jgi:hypothetical protein